MAGRDGQAGPDDDRCLWCGSREGPTERLTARVPDRLAMHLVRVELGVHPRHRSRLRRYLARYRRRGGRFVGGVVTLLVLPVVAATVVHLAVPEPAVRELWLRRTISPLVAAFGLLFVWLPFATPLTTRLLGVRRSTVLVRAMGAAMVAFGAWHLAGQPG